MYVQVSLKEIFYFTLCRKIYKSENTNNNNCVQKYTFNQKWSEESSRNVCSADLEDCIGKEELYWRKITIFDVWDYYSSIYEIMFIQLYWIMKTSSMQIYIFMKKQKAT